MALKTKNGSSQNSVVQEKNTFAPLNNLGTIK